MILVDLVSRLADAQQIRKWSFANARSHDEIDEYLSSIGILPFSFPLDPFPPLNATATWQQYHQQKHLQMNAVFGLPSSDLIGFDFQKPEDRINFANLNYTEHQNFINAAGLS